MYNVEDLLNKLQAKGIKLTELAIKAFISEFKFQSNSELS